MHLQNKRAYCFFRNPALSCSVGGIRVIFSANADMVLYNYEQTARVYGE